MNRSPAAVAWGSSPILTTSPKQRLSVVNILKAQISRRRSQNERFARTPLRFAIAVTSRNIPATPFFTKIAKNAFWLRWGLFAAPAAPTKCPLTGARQTCLHTCRAAVAGVRSFPFLPSQRLLRAVVCASSVPRGALLASLWCFSAGAGRKMTPSNVDQNLLPKV